MPVRPGGGVVTRRTANPLTRVRFSVRPPNKYLVHLMHFGPVAQWKEQEPSKLKVVGSNPTGIATVHTLGNPKYCLRSSVEEQFPPKK